MTRPEADRPAPLRQAGKQEAMKTTWNTPMTEELPAAPPDDPQDYDAVLADAAALLEAARTRQLLGACSHPAIPETGPQQTEPHPETARP